MLCNLCNLVQNVVPTDSTHGTNSGQNIMVNHLDTHGEVELKRNEKGRLYTNDYDWHNQNLWDQIEMNIPFPRLYGRW